MPALRVGRQGWIWMLPLLLLATVLSASLLDDLALSTDESSSALRAGARHPDGHSPAQVIADVREFSPDQALGWPLVLSFWGKLVGWGEPVLRAPALFGGLLAIAMTWRAGRAMFGPAVGLAAAALLASGVYFLTYMAIARVFTFVIFFTVLSLYGYWRVALHPRAPDIVAKVTLLAGAVGLLYTHYFGALLLPALGLFHLLFVRRARRWWQAPLIFALAVLAMLPELEIFLRSVEFNAQKVSTYNIGLPAHEAMARILEVYSSGLLKIQPLLGMVLLGSTGLFLAHEAARRREKPALDALWFVLCVTFIMILLILGANEIIKLLKSGRVRYSFGLWPLLSLLVAFSLYRILASAPKTSAFLLIIVLLNGLTGNLNPSLRAELRQHSLIMPLHVAMREMDSRQRYDDLVLIDSEFWHFGRAISYYSDAYGGRRKRVETFRTPDSTEAEANIMSILETASARPRLWLLLMEADTWMHKALTRRLEEESWQPCLPEWRREYEAEELLLMLYTRDPAWCN